MAVAKFLWEPHATGTARSLLPAVSPAPGERNASRRFFDFHQQQQARQFTSAACRARAAYASSEPRGGCSKRRRSFATLAFSLSLRAQAMNSGTEAALAQCANRFVHSSRSGTSQIHNLLLSKQKSTSTSNPVTNSSPGDEGAPHFRKSSVPHPLYPSPPSPSPSPSSSRDQTIREKESANVTASIGKPAPDTHDSAQQQYTLPHPIWSLEEVESVRVHHTPPKGAVDKLAYYTMKSLRLCFDLFSGYSTGKLLGTLDERRWLTRIIFLETVAGVPGMVAAMTRHLRSLRYLQRDHGWIHTLLEEAENERMHLLTALELRRPGPLFKMAIVAAQGVFVTLFGAVYLISPRYCHRFVGYLEEEAVKTYTLCIESIDRGDLKMWAQMPAPPIAVKYWALKEGAMMRDVILAIRADEAHHRVVNHTLSSMAPSDPNPYHPGQRKT